MTQDEINQMFQEEKAQGMTDQDILGGLYVMFTDGKLTFDQLDAMASMLGYQVSDEFRNMDPQQQKTIGYQNPNQPSGQPGQQASAPAQVPPKAPQANPNPNPSPSPSPAPSANPQSAPNEDEERKKAFGLMGLK